MQLRSRVVSTPRQENKKFAIRRTATLSLNNTRSHTLTIVEAPKTRHSASRRDHNPLHTRCNAVDRKKRRLARGEDDPEEVTKRRLRLLQSAIGPEDCVDESNWITGTLIDLVLWKFAKSYAAVYFLPTAFYHLHLEMAQEIAVRPSWPQRSRGLRSKRDFIVRDVLGRVVDYNSKKPVVFVVNVDQIHWNLFRVQLSPKPKLQLFEPMGKLASRSGISYRSVPRAVIEWLNVCYPQHKCWLQRTMSAIENKQQVSGFDCGVACLLYADKCGRGQSGEEINDSIDQNAITSFRKQLRLQFGKHGFGQR
ncbi:hypothetical protein CCR75_001428 [Bremia lactucae]|uniref:Ubiquitin-like protease family profile domain-containing protein n=1 Tax=Bremia lactucae TaxID=4779 RepID=A0A976FKD5_BRELC|nr:hypothetical protein CCR75_001428 [Bremia lactucae]